jgi:uncharacterized protein (DUF1697 family)
MKTWIALFRGINVGGNNKLPMKELAALLEGLGLSGVRTYIQSGNVVFRSSKGTAAKWSEEIRRAVAERFGFSPWVLVMDAAALRKIATANPFPQAEADHKTLHLFFMAGAPGSADRAGLDALKSPTEAWAIIGPVLYLHAPEGIGRSKLAARAERLLGVETTARNWRTVREVLALAVLQGPDTP